MSQKRLVPVWVRRAFEHANDAGLLSAASAGITEPVAVDQWSDAKLALYHGDTATALPLLRPLAEESNAHAQCLLAWVVVPERGATAENDEVSKWLRKAAAQGLALAQYSLGVLRRDGDHLPRDEKEAERWFHRAAEQGFALAQCALGEMYLDERQWYEEVGLQPERSSKIEPDNAKAIKYLRLAAAQGLPEAQSQLYWVYEHGLGVPTNAVEARKWLLLAADQGDGWSLRLLANDHEEGSEEWLRLMAHSAEAGDNMAPFWLGFFYESHDHKLLELRDPADALRRLGPRDLEKALRWYRFGADHGDSSCQWNLSEMYEKGEGVPRDEAAAVRWCQLAAERGNHHAQFDLGERYAEGRGVPKDMAKAVKLLNTAAEEWRGSNPSLKLRLGIYTRRAAFCCRTTPWRSGGGVEQPRRVTRQRKSRSAKHMQGASRSTGLKPGNGLSLVRRRRLSKRILFLSVT